MGRTNFNKGTYKLIDGSITYKTPCACCHYTRHPGYLSVNLMKTHQCLKKECSLLERNKEHSVFKKKKKDINIKKRDKGVRKLYLEDKMDLDSYKEISRYLADSIGLREAAKRLYFKHKINRYAYKKLLKIERDLRIGI